MNRVNAPPAVLKALFVALTALLLFPPTYVAFGTERGGWSGFQFLLLLDYQHMIAAGVWAVMLVNLVLMAGLVSAIWPKTKD
jgi:hypothetical protein